MKPVVTVTMTPIPTPTSHVNDGFSDFVVKLIESITNVDAMLLLKLLGLWLLLVWGIFSFWVLFDALKRYKSPFIPIVWFLFVLPFNVLGFLGYLFIRPSFTKEEEMYMELDKLFLQYEAYKVTVCPTCKTVVPSSLHYCPKCGTSLLIKCNKCGKLMPIDYKFCTYCGAGLVPLKSKEDTKEVVLPKTPGTSKSKESLPLESAKPSSKKIKVKSKLKLFGLGNLAIGILKGVRFVWDSTVYAFSLLWGYVVLFPIKLLGASFLKYKQLRAKIQERRAKAKATKASQPNLRKDKKQKSSKKTKNKKSKVKKSRKK